MSERRPRTLAFGTWLATRGVIARAAIGLAGMGAVAGVVAAAVVAHRGGHGAAQLPTVASSAIAWSAGVMLAFGGALRAMWRDREEGVLALVRARGAGAGPYVRGRIGGVVALVAIAVGGATLAASLAAVTAAPAQDALRTARASLGAVAYALAFAATVGPVAMAALGARSRAGGYLTLLTVIVLPEMLSSWTSSLLPEGWHELTSIPAALAALRSAVTSPAAMGAHGARAAAGLASVAAASIAIVRLRVPRADAGEPS